MTEAEPLMGPPSSGADQAPTPSQWLQHPGHLQDGANTGCPE